MPQHSAIERNESTLAYMSRFDPTENAMQQLAMRMEYSAFNLEIFGHGRDVERMTRSWLKAFIIQS